MAGDKNSSPRLLTAKELAERLQIQPLAVYKLLRTNKLPGFQIGSRWRIDAEELDRWLPEPVKHRQQRKSPFQGTAIVQPYTVRVRWE